MPDPEFPENLDREPAPPRAAPRGWGGRLFVGVAAALALGAAGGLLMRPDLNGDRPDAQPAARDAALPRLPENLSELLPPAMPMPAAPEFDPDQEPPPEPEPDADAPPEPEETEAEDEPEPEPREDRPVARRFDQVEPRPRPPAPRVTVNCSRANSTAERLVCVDPRLRSLDRQMSAAYGEALASGVPPPVLRRQQQVWLRAREEAAHYGPADLAGVYHARIDELRSMSR